MDFDEWIFKVCERLSNGRKEMTVRDGAYQFWKGEYGSTNELIASYPVVFTVVETETKIK